MAEKVNLRKSFWKSLSILDWVALAVALAGTWATWTSSPLRDRPGFSFLPVLGIIAIAFLLFRFWRHWRQRLLWSLSSRLIVAYFFIAVVPIVLLLIMANVAGQIIYSQLGAYLLYHDIEDRIEMLSDAANHIIAAEETLPKSIDQKTLEKALAAQFQITEEKQLPGLVANFDVDHEYFQKVAGPSANYFSGLVQAGSQLRLVGMKEADTPRGKRAVELTVVVTTEFLETIAPDLGPLEVTLAQRVDGPPAVKIGNSYYKALGRVLTHKRQLPVAGSWMDPVVDGFSKLDAIYLSVNGAVERDHPVIAFFKVRPSQLNRLIFSSVGELSGGRYGILILALVGLLVLGIIGLVIGFVLSRAITRTVTELYRATQYVQEGNFTHRVRVERRDQLGVLGESFNSMTSSIANLISEQKQLQRLENEISIAREVQDQLFPRNLPQVKGVEIEAICRAARSVSGDYYDFIQLNSTNVAVAIADISGKGISAALLMASLQAALRSQLLTPGSDSLSTAELVARLNKHLVRNTGDDRFATFFIAIYDVATRKLRYTNAGHLPGFCLSDGRSVHLDKGGIVLGVVEDYPYEEGVIEVPPSSIVIGYSDGLVEPENAYGEEFGVSRLEAAAQRVRHSPPAKIAESLMTAAEEWSASPEQADDMTVVVARLG